MTESGDIYTVIYGVKFNFYLPTYPVLVLGNPVKQVN